MPIPRQINGPIDGWVEGSSEEDQRSDLESIRDLTGAGSRQPRR